MNEKMYLVKYSTGSTGYDYCQIEVFVTNSRETADKYVERFNKKLDYWIEYMKSFKDEYGFRDEKKCTTAISYRYYDIIEMGHSFIEEVEVR